MYHVFEFELLHEITCVPEFNRTGTHLCKEKKYSGETVSKPPLPNKMIPLANNLEHGIFSSQFFA